MMKFASVNKVILITLVAFLSACNESKYSLREGGVNASYEVPDSLREAYANFIESQVSAATLHLTTCDYEHPEEVIREARSTALVLYGVREPVLCKTDPLFGDCENVNFPSTEEIYIRDSLRLELRRRISSNRVKKASAVVDTLSVGR